MDTITTSIRTDAQLKCETDRLFADLDMNFSAAVNTFLRPAGWWPAPFRTHRHDAVAVLKMSTAKCS